MSEQEKEQPKGIWDYITIIGNHFGTEIIVLFAFIFTLKMIDGNLIPCEVFVILINGSLFLVFGIICVNVILLMYKKIKLTQKEIENI